MRLRTQTARILQVCRDSRAPESPPVVSVAPGPLSWEWHRDTTPARPVASHWWVSRRKTEEVREPGGQSRENDGSEKNEEVLMEKSRRLGLYLLTKSPIQTWASG